MERGLRRVPGSWNVLKDLHQTPEQIVNVAIQEDVDAIGLSSLAGAHNVLFKEVVDPLKQRKAEDIKVVEWGRQNIKPRGESYS